MEVRLTVFVILVNLAVCANTVMLWLIYRAYSQAAGRLARYQRQSEVVMGGFRAAVERAETWSDRAAKWSGRFRASVSNASENVDRAENWLGYGLAKFDFKVDRASGKIGDTAHEIQASISEPLYRTGTIVLGLRAILEFLTPAPQR